MDQVDIFQSFIEQSRARVLFDSMDILNLDLEVAQKIVSSEEPVLITFLQSPQVTDRTYIQLREAFSQIQDQIKVVVADVDTEIGSRYSVAFGIDLKHDSIPQVRIIIADASTSQVRKYALESTPQPTSFDITSFVARFFQGSLQHYLVSQRYPDLPVNTSALIVPLSSQTFKQTLAEGRDTLVYFYTSERCPLCVETWPLLDKAA